VTSPSSPNSLPEVFLRSPEFRVISRLR
jgi:hypothetical protein